MVTAVRLAAALVLDPGRHRGLARRFLAHLLPVALRWSGPGLRKDGDLRHRVDPGHPPECDHNEKDEDNAHPLCSHVIITLESGRLVGDMDGRGKQELVALSRTNSPGLYGLGVQFIDGGLYVKHVSGNYRFARK